MNNELKIMLAEIDFLKSELDLQSHLLNPKLLEEVDINYTFESNRLEGSRLTRPETELAIKIGLTITGKSMAEYLAAINHYQAVKYIREQAGDQALLNEALIKEMHNILMRGINKDRGGVYRSHSLTDFSGYGTHVRGNKFTSCAGFFLDGQETSCYPLPSVSSSDRVDLRVQVGALRLANPVIPASGTFGYGLGFAHLVDLNRLGGFVTKGISLEPIEGAPRPRLCETPLGMLNTIALQIVGGASFIGERLSLLQKHNTNLIVNVFGQALEDYAEVVRLLEDAVGIAAYELNISCPNLKRG